ncbi:hypothetical protein AB0H73_10160 [Streptomyces olivoreticuli]
MTQRFDTLLMIGVAIVLLGFVLRMNRDVPPHRTVILFGAGLTVVSLVAGVAVIALG